MNQPRPLLLILTGSFGDGHNTAARNLKAGFDHLLQGEVRVEVLDFITYSMPKTSALLQKGYLFAINQAPAAWRQIYRMADVGGSGFICQIMFNRKLKAYLEENKPIAVVSTFPAYSVSMAELFPNKSERPFPFYTVITDSITINSMWAKGNNNLLFVTDEKSKRVVAERGTAPEQIRPLGFPIAIRPESELPSDLQPPSVSSKIRLLYIATTGNQHVTKTLEQIVHFCRKHEPALTIVMGRHGKRIRPLIEHLGAGNLPPDLKLHDWIDDVPALMRSHHLVITKAGGATVHEALGMQCPLVINYVVPGQEEGNTALVVEEQCGLHLQDSEELADALERILIKDDAQLWHHFRAQLKRLDRAEASLRIAETVIEDGIGSVALNRREGGFSSRHFENQRSRPRPCHPA